jgi:small-conductance mechanosensitive channel
MIETVTNWEMWAKTSSILGFGIVLGLILHFILFRVLARIADRSKTIFDDSLVKHTLNPTRILFLLIVVRFLLPLLNLGAGELDFLKHFMSLCFIVSTAWLLVNMTAVVEDFILNQYKVDVSDNLQARKIHTQLKVFNRIVVVIIAIITLAAMLMTFEKVRQLGTSILASAGVIGIIIGVAAQRTLSTFIAGFQIAVTQPIRLDDVVIVENEWGRIEEITLTYVVVRIWDLRRLVVPITYFIEKPFQNWTRATADILGTVFLYVDYTVPIQAVREELHRILKESELWDGKAWGLVPTNATERTVELRALMSAPDASTAWNLRCQVRERLIEYVRDNYPEGLPKVRAELFELDKNKSTIPGS